MPQDITFLWDQAYKLGEKNGEELYKEFIRRWQEYEKNSQKPVHSQGEAQRYQQPYGGNNQYQPYQQNQYNPYQNQYNNPYQHSNQYPNQNQYYNPPQRYNQPQYNQQYNQPQYNQPQYNPQPNNYNPPQPVPQQNEVRGNGPVSPPVDNQNSWNAPSVNPRPEPIAGQQVTKWQQMLLNTQQEIIDWGQKNNLEVGSDIIQYWNNAMQRGDEDAYNQFIKAWSEIKEQPDKYKNSTKTTEPWRVAIVNQIEGQGILANMLGINVNSDLYSLRDKAVKDDGTNVDQLLESVMDMWNKLNGEISKRTKKTE